MGKKNWLVFMAVMLLSAVLLCACGRNQGGTSEGEENAGTNSAEAGTNAAGETKEIGENKGAKEKGENKEAEETKEDGNVGEKASASSAEGDGQEIVFTDMAGREIRLGEPVTRVVALTASDCEILYAIGAGDALVGRGEYCDWPEEVNEVPAVQSGADTNTEQIIALKPQVLLMSQMAQTDEQIAALENAGIRVVVSDAQDIEGVYTAIEMIGLLMGKDQEATALVEEMKSTFAEITEKSKAADDGSKKVYFEVSPLQYGLWAAGNNTFMNEIAHMLGVENIFEDVEGWAEISEEQVIERKPDYIVTVTMYFGEGDTPVEEITKRAGWGSIPAVAEKRILNLSNNELSRPGPRLAEGAEELYGFIYGK